MLEWCQQIEKQVFADFVPTPDKKAISKYT